MSSLDENSQTENTAASDNGQIPPHEEALEIVRALSGGEVDAIVVQDDGESHVMALAKLTDLDEINELIRALRSGEIDAFVTSDDKGEHLYSVTPIHEVLAQQYYLTKAITDNATTALLILDDKQKCVFMNPAAEQLTGYTFDEIRDDGRSIHEILHHTRTDGSAYPIAECPISKAFFSENQMKGEEVFVHRDGHSYNIAYSSSPIRHVGGQPVGTVIEIRDITKRKRIEDALLDADKRKDEFIATLAHELRNPLAPISNMLNLMKQSHQDQEIVRQAQEVIERQLEKIVRLVDDLLDVSRITRNSIELRREPIELAATINDAVEMCRPMIEQLDHSIEIETPSESIYLNADAARISQVLGNLINNACKFTPSGGKITIRAARENGDVLISVKDSGIGIPAEKLGSVFEMFAQVGVPVGDTFGGLGIGLALARQLAEMHGGSIEAKSDGDGKGSEFLVRLPVMDAPIIAEFSEAAAENPLPSGRRILVVDDNIDSAESMATLLTLTDNECRMAHSGPDAIKLATQFNPDVILLDIGLPGMDGYEVCRAIRTEPWGGGIAIVAMTGWGQAEDREKSKEAGFDAHLVKPVDFRRLSDFIAEIAPKRDNPA